MTRMFLRRVCVLLTPLIVACQDSTEPSASRDLTGEWDFDIAFAATGNSTCHLLGAAHLQETSGVLTGTLTAHVGDCGVPSTGAISEAVRDGVRVTLVVGSCSFAADALGDPPDSLTGSVACGAATATWTAARVGTAATIKLSPGDSATIVGDRLSYAAAIYDADHHPLYARIAQWGSSAPATADVSPTGVVTALAPGSATISATAEGKRASVTVEVVRAYFVSISAGEYWTCALTPAGDAYCWGGFLVDRTQPTPIPGGVPFVSISVGYMHACGLTAGGAAYCWQEDGSAAPISGGLQFTSLTAGHSYSCGLTASGSAWCWGANGWGQLGSGNTTSGSAPVPVTGGLSFTALFAEGNHTCGVARSGAMYCWGGNWHGELGNGQEDFVPHPAPTAVQGGLTFAVGAAGYFSSCGLTPEGRGFCWGGCLGEIGNGIDTNSLVPVAVAGGRTFSAITGRSYHFCGLDGGAALCWGSNADGQLGDGLTDTIRTVPGPVLGGLSFRQVSAGAFHTCGITSRGVAYCWGWNLQGQLGDGTHIERDFPTRVAGQ